jgi:hypothetical protein
MKIYFGLNGEIYYFSYDDLGETIYTKFCREVYFSISKLTFELNATVEALKDLSILSYTVSSPACTGFLLIIDYICSFVEI